VGRLVTEKGIPVLLEAARQLLSNGYSFQLKIIGDGPERKALAQMTEAFGLAAVVEFLGTISNDDIPRIMEGAVAVVMPSICEDVVGLVAIEQMMQSRLVIAADIGGLGETVGECGLKFPAGDAHALASCMREVLEHPELAFDAGVRAHARASSLFSEETMLEAHVGTYKDVVPFASSCRPIIQSPSSPTTMKTNSAGSYKPC